jgi:hypothetical protein
LDKGWQQRQSSLLPARAKEYLMRSALLGLPLILLLAGCGGRPYGVAKVSGRVTLDNKPLAKASITFVPQATKENQAPGPTAAAFTDADGRYSLGIDSETPGSVVGRCRIFITTLIGDGKAQDPNDDRPGPPVRPKDRVPEKYNMKTTLTFDVPAGGTDQANFDLSSR